MAVSVEIKNMSALKKQIDQMREAPKKVMNSLMGDVRKRAPGWVAQEVANVYGVKKGEVTKGALGSVKVQGNDIRTTKIIYKGRALTPTHFGMTPTVPKPAYTLKASILKGSAQELGKIKKLTKKQRAALSKNFTRSGTRSSDHSPIMLMPTGSRYIPFQRKSTRRNDVEAVKTVSLPQMVSSDRTQDNIQATLNTNIGKRLDHYMNRYIGK